MTARRRDLRDEDYRRLLEFRTALRRFLEYSKMQATNVGLTPTQHQLLLAIRGHGGAGLPTIRDVAEHLLIRHHSAVELIDRAEASGLVERMSDADDQRVVRLTLTPRGVAKLRRISAANLEELRRLGPEFQHVLEAMERLSG